MHLALHMAKLAKGGFSHTAMVETQYLINIPLAEVEEEKMRDVEFPGHNRLKAEMERHPAMICRNIMARCLPYQNRTVINSETRWRCKGTGVPQPNQRRPTPESTLKASPDRTAEPMAPLPGTPPAATSNTSGAKCLASINLPPRYADSHASLPCAQSYSLNASAQIRQDDADFDLDMLTKQGKAAG